MMPSDRDSATPDDGSSEPHPAARGHVAKGRFGASYGYLGDNPVFAVEAVDISLREASGALVPDRRAGGLTSDELTRVVDAFTVDAAKGAWTYRLPAGVIDRHLAKGHTLVLQAQIGLSDGDDPAASASSYPFQLHLNGPPGTPVVVHDFGADLLDEAVTLIAAGRFSLRNLEIGDPLQVRVQPQSAGYVGTLSVPDDDLHISAAHVGTVANVTWNFVVAESEIKSLGAAAEKKQVYDLLFSDGMGEMARQTVVISLTGGHAAPLSQPVARLELSHNI